MYLNTTTAPIAIVLDVKSKVTLIPGTPFADEEGIIQKARETYPVVQYYFTKGSIKKLPAGEVKSKTVTEPESEDEDAGTKEFMLQALKAADPDCKMTKRNSLKSVTEAYEAMMSDD